MQSESDLRQHFVDIGRLMHARNLVAAADGNLSARLGRERILITPSGHSKGFLTPDMLLTVDLQGNLVGTRSGPVRDLQPSSELPMHLECYRQRPDVQGVIHAHPPNAIACTLAGLSLAKCVLPEVVYDLGTVPTAAYATPGTGENQNAIQNLVTRFDALLLDRHGSLTLGSSLWQAYFRLERIEHSAQITLAANAVTLVDPLPGPALVRLSRLREAVFQARGRDVCVECNACPVSERHSARKSTWSRPALDIDRVERLIAEEIQHSWKG